MNFLKTILSIPVLIAIPLIISVSAYFYIESFRYTYDNVILLDGSKIITSKKDCNIQLENDLYDLEGTSKLLIQCRSIQYSFTSESDTRYYDLVSVDDIALIQMKDK